MDEYVVYMASPARKRVLGRHVRRWIPEGQERPLAESVGETGSAIYLDQMRLLSKDELTPAEFEAIKTRLANVHDLAWSTVNMPNSWARLRPERLFAMFDGDTLAGLAAVDGPDDAVDPAWWIDSALRGKRHGSRLVEQLADRLIADGVTGVRPGIPVLGLEWERSAALLRKFRARIARGARTA